MSHDRRNPLAPVLSALAAGALALSLAACAKKEQKTEPAGGDTVHTSTQTPAPDTGTEPPGGAGEDTAAKAAGETTGRKPVRPETEPAHIVVQHILIGFQGSIPGKNITRSRSEAEALAKEILDRAWQGEDFNALVQQYTDDAPPGIYGMANRGATPATGEYPRDGMVAAFGNVGFSISPGNISMADYDPKASPYGWHIIKRLK
jgi:hypothetical protein